MSWETARASPVSVSWPQADLRLAAWIVDASLVSKTGLPIALTLNSIISVRLILSSDRAFMLSNISASLPSSKPFKGLELGSGRFVTGPGASPRSFGASPLGLASSSPAAASQLSLSVTVRHEHERDPGYPTLDPEETETSFGVLGRGRRPSDLPRARDIFPSLHSRMSFANTVQTWEEQEREEQHSYAKRYHYHGIIGGEGGEANDLEEYAEEDGDRNIVSPALSSRGSRNTLVSIRPPSVTSIPSSSLHAVFGPGSSALAASGSRDQSPSPGGGRTAANDDGQQDENDATFSASQSTLLDVDRRGGFDIGRAF